MLRVVIDTSSLVSYVLTHGDLMRRVVAAWHAERFLLLTSPATRRELRAVLARPRIQKLAALPLDQLVRGLERFSWHVPGRLEISGVCRDPKDDMFLACAVEGEAHYLLSSDHDLLAMQYYEGTAIVNPGQFLLALELFEMDEVAIVTRFSRPLLEDVLQSIPLESGTAGRLRAILAA